MDFKKHLPIIRKITVNPSIAGAQDCYLISESADSQCSLAGEQKQCFTGDNTCDIWSKQGGLQCYGSTPAVSSSNANTSTAYSDFGTTCCESATSFSCGQWTNLGDSRDQKCDDGTEVKVDADGTIVTSDKFQETCCVASSTVTTTTTAGSSTVVIVVVTISSVIAIAVITVVVCLTCCKHETGKDTVVTVSTSSSYKSKSSKSTSGGKHGGKHEATNYHSN